MTVREKVKNPIKKIRELNKKDTCTPTCHVTEIFQYKNRDYIVQTQIISKSFHTIPMLRWKSHYQEKKINKYQDSWW